MPDPQGPKLELPNNTGGIVRPAKVLIEYRGNATSQVVPMPKFLRELTGDAKPTSRGPANARATWTCSGFADRLSDKYPICPAGRRVQRVPDFPGCWDGKNIDSDNHRGHVSFADRWLGRCARGATEAAGPAAAGSSGGRSLVVTHLTPESRSALAQTLSRDNALPVATAADGERAKPGHVCVAVPDRHLLIGAGGMLRVTAGPRETGERVTGRDYRMRADRVRQNAETIRRHIPAPALPSDFVKTNRPMS